MNCIQYVTITGNLSFTPALRGCLVQYDLFKPVISSDDTFDPVGCLSALNFRYLQQLGQGILMCLNKQVLLPFLLVDLSQERHDLRGQQLLIFFFIVQCSHSISSFQSLI